MPIDLLTIRRARQTFLSDQGENTQLLYQSNLLQSFIVFFFILLLMILLRKKTQFVKINPFS